MENLKNNNKPEDSAAEKEFEAVKLNTWQNIKKFFIELFDIHTDSDRDATIESVKKEISFKGHTDWILIISIILSYFCLYLISADIVYISMHYLYIFYHL